MTCPFVILAVLSTCATGVLTSTVMALLLVPLGSDATAPLLQNADLASTARIVPVAHQPRHVEVAIAHMFASPAAS